MNDSIHVAVVILNWNGKRHLEQFLPSVIQYSSSPEVEIIVADNGSSDDSVKFLHQNYIDRLKIIVLDKNYGFAGGYNKALEQVKATYYILLNSDVEVTDQWISPVIKYMEEHRDVAACMPKIKDFYHRDTFEYAGAAGGYIDKLGYPFCRGRIFNHLEKDTGQYDDIKDIFWATGACMFVRSEYFKGTGGFDPDFFAHMEEIDLCWRWKNKGYRIVYIPHSHVYHVGGGTLPHSNPWKTYLNYRNSLFMLCKNLPDRRLRTRIFFRQWMDIISAFKFAVSFKGKDVIAIVKGYITFYRRRSMIIAQRKTGKGMVVEHPEVYRKNIVWQYYIKRKKTFCDLNF